MKIGPRGHFSKMSSKWWKPSKMFFRNASKNGHPSGPNRTQFSTSHNFLSTKAFWMGSKYVRGGILKFVFPHRRTQYMHQGTNPQFWFFFREFKKKFKSQKQKWHECAIWVHVWGCRSGMLKAYYWWILWAKNIFEILKKKKSRQIPLGNCFPKKWSLDPIFKKL